MYFVYSISMKKEYLAKIKEILDQYMGNEPVEAFIFGSRATGKAKITSDFDIGIRYQKGCKSDEVKLSKLREAFEESTLPFDVDVVDIDETGKEFREEALKKVIYIKR
jgi:predicted nucleotidyltransferase